MPLPLSTILHASLLYALLIFTSGFFLGCIRVPFIEPILGPRYAQLLEMPLMLLVVRRAAGVAVAELHRHVLWTTTHGGRRLLEGQDHRPIRFSAFLVGVLALGLFLVLEVGVYMVLNRGQGKSGWDWIGEMDWIVRVGFLGVLGVVPVLPVWLC